MDFSFVQIMQWLIAYRYIILFPIAVVEGPMITIIAGFLSSLGYLNVFLVYLVVVLGELVGDCLYYAIGRLGRKSFIERWGKYFFVNEKRVEHLEKHFKKHGIKTLIFGKLSQVFSTVTLISAGAAKMPFLEYFWIIFLVTLPKSLMLLFIGYFFGRAYVEINRYLNYFSLLLLALAVLLTAIYMVIGVMSKKYEEEGVH